MRHGGLHAESHFVLGDARDGFRAAELFFLHVVEIAHGIEREAAHRAIHALGIGYVEHGVTAAAALNALEYAGKEAAAPRAFAGAGECATGDEHDEPGQVGGFAAKSVGHPRSEGGPALPGGTGVEQQFRRGMVELFGVHRFDEGQIVSNRRHVRQRAGHPGQARSCRAMPRISGRCQA